MLVGCRVGSLWVLVDFYPVWLEDPRLEEGRVEELLWGAIAAAATVMVSLGTAAEVVVQLPIHRQASTSIHVCNRLREWRLEYPVVIRGG